LAPSAHDDGFHEIQLNGKQLVFLFMAATVVSVVIFLCGVLVGRGVRAERATAVAEASGLATVPPADAAPASPTPATPAGSDPTKAAPPPAVDDDLSYFDRLDKPGTPKENLKPADDPAADKPAPKSAATTPAGKAENAAPKSAAAAPAEKPAPKSAAPAAASARAASGEPAGNGYAVQVAALNVRSEADAIARRLAAKGYAAYVVTPANGTSMFRVRVGKFGSRREAEGVAARLQKEEQFKPWITR
jgi:cell division septation protein DedD